MERPIILTQELALKSLAESAFLEAVPELRQCLALFEAVPAQGRGCSGCKRRRHQAKVFAEFTQTVLALDPQALQRLKAYWGAPQVMVSVVTSSGSGIRVL